MTFVPITLEPPLSIKDAAQHLGCSEQSVRRMVADGQLKHFKVGRLYRIPQSAIRIMEEELAEPLPSSNILTEVEKQGLYIERSFTIRTAAIHLGCSENHIRNLIRSKQIEYFTLGSLVRIPQSAIRALELGLKPNEPKLKIV